MKIPLINGPLDGGEFETDKEPEASYIILQAQADDTPILYCCYKYKNGQMFFVNSKTREQLLGMNHD
jgi:hypothetical protein